MPSQIDNTYHYEFSKPTYDTVEDQIRQQRIREAEYILEPAVPALPSREDELEYMNWLQEDIKSDPWLTLRYKKFMANPKRVPFKNMLTLKQEYRREFYYNFAFGALLGWPLAVLVGKRAQTYQGGVAVVPYQRWVHDFPNVHPMRTTWRFFRRWSLATCALSGYTFARYMGNESTMANQWYTRPDLKQKAAMVKDDSYDDAVYQQLLE